MEDNTITSNSYDRKHEILIQSNQSKKIDLLLSFVWYYSLDGEVWKEIKDTNSNYFVSNYGRVLSLCCDGYKLLKQQLNDDYYYVKLSINGKSKTPRVNRLVALAFLDNPDNKPLVHHKDNNKRNNRVDNLEFVTYLEHSKAHSEKDNIIL